MRRGKHPQCKNTVKYGNVEILLEPSRKDYAGCKSNRVCNSIVNVFTKYGVICYEKHQSFMTVMNLVSEANLNLKYKRIILIYINFTF